MTDRIALLSALLPKASDDPRALIAIARHMISAGDRVRAIALAEQVHAMTGGRGEAGALLRIAAVGDGEIDGDGAERAQDREERDR